MEESVRCFIAIKLPESLRKQIDQFSEGLKRAAPKVKWVRSASLHVTLKFLGNIEPAIVDRVAIRLMPVAKKAQPFQLTVRDFGAFPNAHRPRVFWLGLRADPEKNLHELQHLIEDDMETLGFDREKRVFSPHLTLGRVKFPENFADLWRQTEQQPFPEVTFYAEDFYLMRSLLKPQGAEYRELQKYSLHAGD